MKVGLIGAGAVGSASLLSLVMRGTRARSIGGMSWQSALFYWRVCSLSD